MRGNCRGKGSFKNCGFRMTLPRQVIMEVLDETSEIITAEDIFMKVHQEYPGVGIATVYRTLNMLTEMGLVTRYDFGDGKARFELAENTDESIHSHVLICKSCYKAVKYSDFSEEEKELFHNIESKLEKKHGFKISNHIVQYYGLCEKCRK